MREPRRGLMRFFKDDPGRLTPIVWYAVPWTREPLGLPTVFTSSGWDDESGDPAVGEVTDSMQWWAARPAPFEPLGRPGRCGTPQQWNEGQLTTDPPAPIDPRTGAPVCCGPAVPIFPMGEAIGASATWARSMTADAGEAVGAAQIVAIKIIGNAGEAVGAESSDPSLVTVACCPNPLPWTMSVLIEATGHWAFLDGSAFSQNYSAPTPTPGALGWQGTWTDPTQGDATLLVWCAPGFGWLFRWSGWITSGSIGADFGTVCDPFKLVATIGYIFPASTIRAIVQGSGPAMWTAGISAGVAPSATWTPWPSWSGGFAAGVVPSATWTPAVSWSGGFAAGVVPSATWTPAVSWSGGFAAGVVPSATWSAPPSWSAGIAAGVVPSATWTPAP